MIWRLQDGVHLNASIVHSPQDTTIRVTKYRGNTPRYRTASGIHTEGGGASLPGINHSRSTRLKTSNEKVFDTRGRALVSGESARLETRSTMQFRTRRDYTLRLYNR